MPARRPFALARRELWEETFGRPRFVTASETEHSLSEAVTFSTHKETAEEGRGILRSASRAHSLVIVFASIASEKRTKGLNASVL